MNWTVFTHFCDCEEIEENIKILFENNVLINTISEVIKTELLISWQGGWSSKLFGHISMFTIEIQSTCSGNSMKLAIEFEKHCTRVDSLANTTTLRVFNEVRF